MSKILGDQSEATASLILIASGAVAPALMLGVVRGGASGLHEWGLVARERVITSSARLAGVATLALVGALSPLSTTLVLVISPLLGIVAYRRILRRLFVASKPAFGRAVSARWVVVSFGLRTWVGSVSGVLLMRLDQVLMIPLTTTYQLGLYAVAVTVAELPLVVNSAFRDVTFVHEASSSSSERVSASARISAMLCIVLGIPLALSVPILVPLLFGRDFDQAVPITVILIVAVVVGTPGSVAGATLSGRGRPGIRSAALTIACALNLCLVLWLVPLYRGIGAAWATLAGNICSSNLNIIALRIFCGVPMLSMFGVRRSDIYLLRRVATIRLRAHRANLLRSGEGSDVASVVVRSEDAGE